MQLTGGALLVVFIWAAASVLGMATVAKWPERIDAASRSARLSFIGLGAVVILLAWWRTPPRGARALAAGAVVILVAWLSWPIAFRVGGDIRLRGWLADARPAFERTMGGTWQLADGEVQSDLDGTLYRVSRGMLNMGPSRGVVYDVTGALATQPRGERGDWNPAPAAIASHFGGGRVSCRPIREIYFFCQGER